MLNMKDISKYQLYIMIIIRHPVILATAVSLMEGSILNDGVFRILFEFCGVVVGGLVSVRGFFGDRLVD